METYKCNNCGMSVNASCAKCNQPLVNGHLTLEDELKFKYQVARLVRAK